MEAVEIRGRSSTAKRSVSPEKKKTPEKSAVKKQTPVKTPAKVSTPKRSPVKKTPIK